MPEKDEVTEEESRLLESLAGLVPPPAGDAHGAHSQEPDGLPSNSVIDLVAASFHHEVRQIWNGGLASEYLGASDAKRHVWHAWLASQKALFEVRNPMSIKLAYKHLKYSKRSELIRQSYGCVPAGVLNALGKLGPVARPVATYRALIKVLADNGRAAKFICHARELPDETIVGLASVPSDTPVEPVLAILKGRRADAESLGFLFGTVSWLRATQGGRVADGVLASPKPIEALWEKLCDLPFATPPWPEDRLISPVMTHAGLMRVARDLQNCLTHAEARTEAVMGAINGNRCYYSLVDEPALLEFVRITPIGWYLRQVCGPQNQEVSASTLSRVLERLSREPNYCATWQCRWTGNWDGGHGTRHLEGCLY